MGRLLPDLMKGARSYEGFIVIAADAWVTLKLYTLLQRGRSPKGKKDFIDILSLFQLPDISAGKIKKNGGKILPGQGMEKFSGAFEGAPGIAGSGPQSISFFTAQGKN